jgi:hypothetical protein
MEEALACKAVQRYLPGRPGKRVDIGRRLERPFGCCERNLFDGGERPSSGSPD